MPLYKNQDFPSKVRELPSIVREPLSPLPRQPARHTSFHHAKNRKGLLHSANLPEAQCIFRTKHRDLPCSKLNWRWKKTRLQKIQPLLMWQKLPVPGDKFQNIGLCVRGGRSFFLFGGKLEASLGVPLRCVRATPSLRSGSGLPQFANALSPRHANSVPPVFCFGS